MIDVGFKILARIPVAKLPRIPSPWSQQRIKCLAQGQKKTVIPPAVSLELATG